LNKTYGPAWIEIQENSNVDCKHIFLVLLLALFIVLKSPKQNLITEITLPVGTTFPYCHRMMKTSARQLKYSKFAAQHSSFPVHGNYYKLFVPVYICC